MKSQKKTHGLILGKFAPLHKGHQYLIETALHEMDEVTVVIYNCPDVIDVPLNVRAQWIRTLYPAIHVIEAWDGPADSGYTPRIKKIQEDYVRKIVTKNVTHFYSSERYGEHMSVALHAVNRVVDIARNTFPISGTMVRANPYTQHAFVDPIVYKDLVKKIVFLGAESTGKSTIAQRMAHMYHTTWMPEFGREYWGKYHVQGVLSQKQLVQLAQGHMQQEEVLMQYTNHFLFVDTNVVTTALFAQYYHGTISTTLRNLVDRAALRYDLVFVCGTDIPYEEDGTRSGAEHRIQFQKQIINYLESCGITYHIVQGAIEDRAATVTSVMNKRFHLRGAGSL